MTGSYKMSPHGFAIVRFVFDEFAKTKLLHTIAIHNKPPGRMLMTSFRALRKPATPGGDSARVGR